MTSGEASPDAASVAAVSVYVRAVREQLPRSDIDESRGRIYRAQDLLLAVAGEGTELDSIAHSLDAISQVGSNARAALGAAHMSLREYLLDIGVGTGFVAPSSAAAPRLAPLSTLRPRRYEYVGPYRHHPEVVQEVDNYLRASRPQPAAIETADHGMEAQLEALGNCIEEMGKDVGVDLSDRRPGVDRFHIYSPEEYRRVREQYSFDETSVAFHSTSGHMVVSKKEELHETLASANHEAVHVAGHKSIRIAVTQTEEGATISADRQNTGIQNERTQALGAINEALTEIVNIDLMRNYWPNHSALRHIAGAEYKNVGYLPQLILIDEILKNYFDQPARIYKELKRSVLTGETGRLRVLHSVLGTPMMRRLSQMRESTSADAVAIAEDLGLHAAVDKIRRNDASDLLNWL